MTPHSPDSETGSFPHADADKCVQCGLCIPHCPTYQQSKDENESPRGRIALMRALASQQLPAGPRLFGHLSTCLSCRNCEAVCPAQVPYGRLIDSARALIARSQHPTGPPWSWRLLVDGVLTRPARTAAAGRLLRIYQYTGLRKLLRSSGVLRWLGLDHLDRYLPELSPQRTWASYYPPHGEHRGDVALFLGCIARVVDRSALDGAIELLRRFGYGVRVPDKQVCCGALHQHTGFGDRARSLMDQNVAAFAGADRIPIVTVASGCGAMLVEYGDYVDGGAVLAQRITDFHQFVAGIEWPDSVRFRRTGQRVAVHEPCTLRNVQRAARFPYAVLERADLGEIVRLGQNQSCCGAAGTYFIDHPEMSRRLLDDQIDAIIDSAADVVVTSNVGCALHLAAGLQARGLAIEVVHPAAFLRRLLQ